MSIVSWTPDPGQPPRPTVYPPIPVVYTSEPPSFGEDLRDQLLERRIVLASGRLDDAAAMSTTSSSSKALTSTATRST